MKPITNLNVASAQVATHPVNVTRVRGNFNGTTATRFLHLFDSNGQPAPGNGAVPLIAPIPLYTASAGQPIPFFAEFEFGALPLASGLFAAVSTTQETFTQSTDTMDLTVELGDPEEPAGTSWAGDTVTGVDSLVVYATSATTNLFAVNVTNNGAATAYLQLFTYANPATGAAPHFQWAVAAGQTRNLVFGKPGMHPLDGPTTSETQGCYLYGSSTEGTFTATSATQWNLQAEYGSVAKG